MIGGGAGPVAMAMKLLIMPKEASAILGTGGSICKEIEQNSSARLHFSSRADFYPGTQLQELWVKGATTAAVATALNIILQKLAEAKAAGRIAQDSEELSSGGSSLKLVVPNYAAKAIIGRGGANIKILRDSTGTKMNVESTAVGPPPIAEQCITIYGSLGSIQAALHTIFEKMEQECAPQSWFSTWASTNHAGTDGGLNGALLFTGSKGKSKGEYGGMSGYGASPVAANPGQMEMVANALERLPASLALPGDMSQQITFNIPDHTLASLIGEAGETITRISQVTGTKIQIRDFESNPSEKVVNITGNAVSVISAYCHCVARANPSQQMQLQQMQQQHQQLQPQQQLQLQHPQLQLSYDDQQQPSYELPSSLSALAEAELQQAAQLMSGWRPQG